jgi:hypothetical protein
MKAIPTMNAQNANLNHKRLRSLIIFAGIVIMILCFAAVLQEPHSLPNVWGRVFALVDKSQIIAADLFTNFRTFLW